MIQNAKLIQAIFRNHPERCEPLFSNALKINTYIRRISAFIDRHTACVCSKCTTKCCINRHAYYTLDDLIYFSALGVTPEAQELQRSIHSEYCQFLTNSGCLLERHQRPLGCTWHFCDELTVHMQKDDLNAYRNFTEMFDELFLTWLEFSGMFRVLFRELSGKELDENHTTDVTHGLTYPWARILPKPFSGEKLKEK